jgi:hypothetical protein
MENEVIPFQLDLPKKLHEVIKIDGAVSGDSMRKLIIDILRKHYKIKNLNEQSN